MKKAATISIVIPAFNEEKLLPHSLKSLRNQDYQGNCEIIVVDNASTDGTARVAAELGSRIVSCSRRGVVYARQAGAMAASGDIIVQADADTVYPEDWLSRIAHHFISHPESVALAGAYVYQNQPRWARLEYAAKYLINQIGLLLFGRPAQVSGANFAFRREAFLKTKGYQAQALYPDQWGISRSLSRVGKVSYDKNLLVFTSTRRVQKPFRSLLCDVALNSARILAYFIQHNVNLLRTSPAQLLLRRITAKRTTLRARW